MKERKNRKIWKNADGKKRPMSEMSQAELQEALEVAEKLHVESENAIQRAFKRSSLFLEKIQQLQETARNKNLKLTSLCEKHPGKYKILENTYRLEQEPVESL